MEKKKNLGGELQWAREHERQFTHLVGAILNLTYSRGEDDGEKNSIWKSFEVITAEESWISENAMNYKDQWAKSYRLHGNSSQSNEYKMGTFYTGYKMGSWKSDTI